MDARGMLYFGVTTALFIIFACIVYRTYKKERKDEMEAPKHRMLDDDPDRGQT